MLSIENFNRLLAASSGNDHQNPLINAMIVLFGVPFLLTILRKTYAFLSGGSRRQSQYNALVKKLLCDEEKKLSQSLLDDNKNKNANNTKSSGSSSTPDSSSSSSSFTSISDALHGQRDESVREFCRLITYRLVEQAANGRSDYEFHFRSFDLWFEFKEVGAGLFTIFNIRSYWNCVDSQGSRDVIKEILEGRDGARAVSSKVDSGDEKKDDDDDDDDEKQEKQEKQQSTSSSASAQYSSPYYYSSLHQASVRNHYKKHEEESKKHSSQNGLRVDWSVASNYGSNPFAPKWILSCKWDRQELTRAREFGGR